MHAPPSLTPAASHKCPCAASRWWCGTQTRLLAWEACRIMRSSWGTGGHALRQGSPPGNIQAHPKLNVPSNSRWQIEVLPALESPTNRSLQWCWQGRVATSCPDSHDSLDIQRLKAFIIASHQAWNQATPIVSCGWWARCVSIAVCFARSTAWSTQLVHSKCRVFPWVPS